MLPVFLRVQLWDMVLGEGFSVFTSTFKGKAGKDDHSVLNLLQMALSV
jgi:hypothetical protein